jgi:hypothetical protein
MISYPLIVSRDYVEEVDLKNLLDANSRALSSRHSQPGTSSTRTEEVIGERVQLAKTRIKDSSNNQKGINRFIKF